MYRMLVAGAFAATLALSSPAAAPASPVMPGGRPDTLRADVRASVVKWKGTKFGGRGSHSGTLHLSGGELIVGHGDVRGGSFTVDMRTLMVTDIPATDPVPRNRLRRHLIGPDFFDIAKYPTASFRATGAVRTGERTYRLQGELAMHGAERPIEMAVTVVSFETPVLVADGRVVLDRHQWGLDYKGSAITNDLLDDDITLDVRLVARRTSPIVSASPREAAVRRIAARVSNGVAALVKP